MTDEPLLPKAYNTTVTDTYEQLDQVLNYMADGKLKSSDDIAFNVSHLADTGQLIQKLLKDEYIEKLGSDNDVHYQITFEGKHFLNNTWYFWVKNGSKRAYTQMRGIQRIKTTWTIAKTIIVILNGLSIILLMYWANRLSGDRKEVELKLEVATKLSEEQEVTIGGQAVTIGELERRLHELTNKRDTTNK